MKYYLFLETWHEIPRYSCNCSSPLIFSFIFHIKPKYSNNSKILIHRSFSWIFRSFFINFKNTRCTCNKIFVPAWNLFRRNLFHRTFFCRNFLNEKLAPGTYFIGKFIPPMWNYKKQLLVSLLDKVCSPINIWLISRQWCKILNGIKNKYEFIYNITHVYNLGLSAKWKANIHN